MKNALFGFLVMMAVFQPAWSTTPFEGDKVKAGLERMKQGDFEGALAKFRDAQIDHPSSDELHFNIGMALYRLDRFEEAQAAFESASFSRNKEIEKKALFHMANCYVKEGKLEKALEHLNRTLTLDENYQAAKVNREYVVRKIKELARKQKKQDEKKKQERRIIEKLQELIQKQLGVHAVLRDTLRTEGRQLPPTRVKEMASFLDKALDPKAQADAAQIKELRAEVGRIQSELPAEIEGIIQEVEKKISGSEAAASQGPAGGAPAQQNPEIAKLEKALPHLQAAEPNIERAKEAILDENNFLGAHAAQEQAVLDLMAALNELLDELTRMIKEQTELLTQAFTVSSQLKEENAGAKPSLDQQSVLGTRQKSEQSALRKRAEAFAKGIEQHLQGLIQKLEEKQAPNAPGVQPGEDPKADIRKFELALSHMNGASGFMEEAEVSLAGPNFEVAVTQEQSALQELMRARAALSPPQQQNGDKQQEQKDGQKEEEKESEDGQKDDGKNSDPNDDQQESKPKEGEARELSEEQAKKTLEQQKQREMDRRREKKDKMKKSRRGKSRGVKKDW